MGRRNCHTEELEVTKRWVDENLIPLRSLNQLKGSFLRVDRFCDFSCDGLIIFQLINRLVYKMSQTVKNVQTSNVAYMS